jgi:hypothetical protein
MLARLLVLHRFLLVAQRNLSGRFHESRPFLCLNWLMMQRFPAAFPASVGHGMDIFIALGDPIRFLDDALVEVRIRRTMSLIRSLIHSSPNDPSDRHGLFFAIDKAQVAAKEGYGSFRGVADGRRPYLREFALIVRDVEGLTLVVTGTSPSLTVVRETLESGIGKPEIVHGVYNTGWFQDGEAQRHYLNLYYQPELGWIKNTSVIFIKLSDAYLANYSAFQC